MCGAVDSLDGLRPYNGATDFYNYAPVNALVTPNDTWNINGAGEYLVAEKVWSTSVNIFGEIGYTKRASAQRLAPDASFSLGDFSCDNTLQPGDVVAVPVDPAKAATVVFVLSSIHTDRPTIPPTHLLQALFSAIVQTFP